MIDYEKLKIAHELANILYDKTFNLVLIEHYINAGCSYLPIKLYINEQIYVIGPIDTIINELEKFISKSEETKDFHTKKYNLGQVVWTYINGNMYKCTVEDIYWEPELNDYRVNLIKIGQAYGRISTQQADTYSSQEDLIAAQVNYWLSLQNQIPENNEMIPGFEEEIKGFKTQCIHQSDENIYTSFAPQYKCIKCGEFYR